jgi:hypothetical protein
MGSGTHPRATGMPADGVRHPPARQSDARIPRAGAPSATGASPQGPRVRAAEGISRRDPYAARVRTVGGAPPLEAP